MNKRNIFVLLVLIIGASICFGGGQSDEEGSSGNAVELTAIMPDWEDKARFQEAFDEFSSRNTNLTVEPIYVPTEGWGDYFTKVRTMIASGEQVDVIRMPIEGVQEFLSNDLLLPLGKYIEEKPELVENYNDLHPNLQSIFEVDGEVYGFVWDWNNMVTHINLDMLEDAGLPFPDEYWDKEEFLRYAQALTGEKDGQKVFGALIPTFYFAYSSFLYAFGGSIFNDDMTECTLDKPEAFECFQFLHDLVYKYKVSPVPNTNWSQEPANKLAAGQVAMIFAGRWVIPTLANNDVNFNVQYIPKFKERTVIFGSGGFPVATTTKNPEEAYMLSAFLSSSWTQRKTLSDFGIPARISVMDEILPNAAPDNSMLFRESADVAKAVQSPAKYTEVEMAMNAIVNTILASEDVDIKAVLAEAVKELNGIIE